MQTGHAHTNCQEMLARLISDNRGFRARFLHIGICKIQPEEHVDRTNPADSTVHFTQLPLHFLVESPRLMC